MPEPLRRSDVSLRKDVGSLIQQSREVREHITELRKQIAVLERKSRGTTRANKEIARLTQQVNELQEKFLGAGPTDAVLAELTRLDTSTKNLYLEVAGHGDRIRALEQSPAMQIDFEKSEIEIAHKLETGVETPWVGALVVAAVAAFCTALALNWWIAQSWNSTKDFWASVIVGFAAFWIFASFEKHFAKLDIEAQMNWAKIESKSKSDEQAEDPTVVLPAAEGVS